MKRLLPIGIQGFAKIRGSDYIYVDKTARIHRLVSSGEGAFFLSRPRRFGKSLLCSTLGAIFEGRRELFKGLAIDSLDWEWKKHPVVHLDLNPGNYSEGLVEMHATINRGLELCARKYDVPFVGETISDRFARLIHAIRERWNERVVVIVDEYDKPMLGTIDEPQVHKKIRAELKGFYGVLKSCDEHLKFVFLTGVTKFSHVSVFSDLNHLVDLTLNPQYADLCGITQEELEQSFGPEIDGVLENTGRSRENYIAELRRFYNGYRFSKKHLKVYNPFGLLNHFSNEGEFLPYWYETGTPTFLINIIIKQRINIADLRDLRVGYEDFRKYDIEDMRAEPLLYQSGYLTIADYDEDMNQFALDYPNEEVRTSFAKSLLEQCFQPSQEASSCVKTRLPQALLKGDVDGAMEALRSFFALIPYDIIKETENYYETAIHIIFTAFGMNCRSEVRIASGRIDTLVETKNFVYCFEFKLKGTAKEALAQIDTKDYLLPWAGSGKTLFKVGVSFDLEKRNIGEWITGNNPPSSL